MYRFVDINEKQSVTDLPAEAMQVNGAYLENEIPGYRTLYTEGRETLTTEISTIDSDYVDGAIEDSARDLSRVIRVWFLLTARSPQDFREKFNRLNRILRERDSVFIFEDEPDKFFRGTKTDITEIEPGKLMTKGCIEITCNDPYKYSVNEKSVTLVSSGNIVIDYEGSKETFPAFTASMTAGPNGYLAFSNQTGALIRFGNIASADSQQTDETVIFEQGYNEMSLWDANSADIPSYGGSARSLTGTIAPPALNLKPGSYGSGVNAWHGVAVSRSVLASDSFRFDWSHSFWQEDSNAKQAEFICTVSDANGSEIAGVRYVYDRSRAANKIDIELYVSGTLRKTWQAVSYHSNSYTGDGHGSSSISKSGGYILFDIAGHKYGVTEAGMENTEAVKVNFFFGVYGSSAGMQTSQIYSSGFISYSTEKVTGTADHFKKGDVVTVDCKEAASYLNGVLQYGLGDIRNEWQGMKLVPGKNVITCQASSWSKGVGFEIRYREAWL